MKKLNRRDSQAGVLDWVTKYDENWGMRYYENRKTGEIRPHPGITPKEEKDEIATQKRKPPPPKPKALRVDTQLSMEWYEEWDDNYKRKYYYCPETKESSWEKPEGHAIVHPYVKNRRLSGMDKFWAQISDFDCRMSTWKERAVYPTQLMTPSPRKRRMSLQDTNVNTGTAGKIMFDVAIENSEP